MLRVYRVTVAMAVFEAAEAAWDGPLYRALRAIDWASGAGEAFEAVLAERDVAPLREALAGSDGWTAVDISDEYVLGRAREDANHDGFGTRELDGVDARGRRTVAVRREHLDWQTARYDSWEPLSEEEIVAARATRPLVPASAGLAVAAAGGA